MTMTSTMHRPKFLAYSLARSINLRHFHVQQQPVIILMRRRVLHPQTAQNSAGTGKGPPRTVLSMLVGLFLALVPGAYGESVSAPPHIDDQCIHDVALWLNARDYNVYLLSNERSVWFEKRAVIVVSIFLAIFIVLIIGLTVFLHVRTSDEDDDVGIPQSRSEPQLRDDSSSPSQTSVQKRRLAKRNPFARLRHRRKQRKRVPAEPAKLASTSSSLSSEPGNSREQVSQAPSPVESPPTSAPGQGARTPTPPAPPTPPAQRPTLPSHTLTRTSSVDTPYVDQLDQTDVEAVDAVDVAAISHPPAYRHTDSSSHPSAHAAPEFALRDAHVSTDDKHVFSNMAAAASAPPAQTMAQRASAPLLDSEDHHGKGKHRAVSLRVPNMPSAPGDDKQHEANSERQALAMLVPSSPGYQLPRYAEPSAPPLDALAPEMRRPPHMALAPRLSWSALSTPSSPAIPPEVPGAPAASEYHAVPMPSAPVFLEDLWPSADTGSGAQPMPSAPDIQSSPTSVSEPTLAPPIAAVPPDTHDTQT